MSIQTSQIYNDATFFRDDEFWRVIPAYASIDQKTFLDHLWQNKNSITTKERLVQVLGPLASDYFYKDIEAGLHHVPMSVRLTPYVMSLINWKDPYHDPLRRQFLPLVSELIPDHPKLALDSLSEVQDQVAPGLTHRYPDKALFLALTVCPVYCRFCTRSYAVGVDTEDVKKTHLGGSTKRWEQVFAYIRSCPTLEDIVISGGDASMLKGDQIRFIGNTLLDISHVRRMRFATKGPAIVPMKVLTDEDWFLALVEVVERGRKMGKDVVVHTHFNHPNEITGITQRAMNRFFQAGVTVRNQSVLLRNVNDSVDIMQLLIKKLSYLNIHPYYVYQHDMVKGVEDMRTTVATALSLEKAIRGATAGFNTPTFVVDAPGGGGKRDVNSYETYNPVTGISVYRSPNVDESKLYFYFDPITLLPPEGQKRWADKTQHETMIHEAREKAG